MEEDESWSAPIGEQTIIEVRDRGPLVVYGEVIIRDKDGKEVKKSRQTSLCRCGASTKKPFCDGNHKNVVFED